MAKRLVTVRRYLLGMELRRLRTAAGVTQEAASEHIDMDNSKMSRVENGTSPISRPELVELLRLYGVEKGDELFDFLGTLHREARKRGWWYEQRGVIPPSVQQLIELESSAASRFQFAPAVVPGLLQTESYARALISSFPLPGSADVDKIVEIRMARQKILTEDGAPQLICILDEAALHRRVGGAKVQAEQLHRLAELSAPPSLTIQVVPYAQGIHAGLDGGFMLFSYPAPISMEFAFVEYLNGQIFLEGDAQVQPFRRTADHLRAQALSSDESMKLISRVARDLEKSG